MDVPDPLADLLAHLARDGRVPLAWVVAHAPQGDLRGPWHACPHATVLVQLARRVAPARTLVRATAACARLALAFERAPDPRAWRALALAEVWARGEAVGAQALLRAAQAAGEATRRDLARQPATGVAFAAGAWHDAPDAVPAWDPDGDDSLLHAVSEAAEVVANGSERAPGVARHNLAELAIAARGQLPCPTLAALRAAFAAC